MPLGTLLGVFGIYIGSLYIYSAHVKVDAPKSCLFSIDIRRAKLFEMD